MDNVTIFVLATAVLFNTISSIMDGREIKRLSKRIDDLEKKESQNPYASKFDAYKNYKG